MTDDIRKYITLIESVLSEGRDAPLYHFTYLHNLLGILQDHRLGFPNQSVSLSRDPNHPHGLMFATQAVLVIDQSKLANRYSMTPDQGGMDIEQHEERIDREIFSIQRYLKYIAIDFSKLTRPDYAKLWKDNAEIVYDFCRTYHIPLMSGNWHHDKLWFRHVEPLEIPAKIIKPKTKAKPKPKRKTT